MTAAELLSVGWPHRGRCEHADRATYRAWVWQHVPGSSVRSNRLQVFDEFVERWPRLEDWFAAPLRQRLLDQEDCVRGQHPHGGASRAMPYLSFLSLVHGVGLDYEVLLGRTFASPFTVSVTTAVWGCTASCSTDTWPG